MNYNECVKWLMKHDRTQTHRVCVDKLAARELVPHKYRIPLLGVSAAPQEPNQYPCVIKCNHDSGSSTVLRNQADYHAAKPFIESRLQKVYGVNKGEWAYQYVKPRVMIEQLLDDPTDYKFHVSGGLVRWVQVITGRDSGARETIFNCDGDVMPFHFDEQMQYHPDPAVYPGRTAWEQMKALALMLAYGFRYVRIDLYYSGQPYFGEFTFWPRAGNYASNHLDFYGALLCLKS
jgi:hypothetical protein